jgi:competence protein ComEC
VREPSATGGTAPDRYAAEPPGGAPAGDGAAARDTSSAKDMSPAGVTPPAERATRGIDARLLLPALVAWTGAALGLSRPPLAVLGTAGALTALSLLLIGRRWRRLRWTALLAITALSTALCLVSLGAQSLLRQSGLVPELARERATVTVDGVVTTDPRVVATTGPTSTELVLVRLDVRLVTGRGEQSRVHTPVLVFGDASWKTVRWHETVRSTGRLDVADGGDDVVAVLNPRGPPTRLRGAGWTAAMAESVRGGLRRAVRSLPADARGLLPALVIGDTSRTPASLTEAMLATGMTHLSAVSGSNVAVVLAAGMGLCRVVGIRRRWRPVVAGIVLAGFVVLARPEPSVLRAAVMGVIGLMGLSASRRRAGIPALAGAVVALLVIDPWLARSFGFALSTLATLGLLLFAGAWGRWFARFLPARVHWLGAAIAIPVAAQAMCGPVVVLLQGSVSVIGVLANVLAAPMVAPATVLGVAVALVAVVAAPVAAALAWTAMLPTLGIAWVARSCADVPMGSLPWPDGASGAFLLAGLSILLLFCGPWLVAVLRHRPGVVAAFAVVSLAAAWPTADGAWPPTGWRIVACDVGQGDGLALATAPGHAVVVDAGPDPVPMDACLRRLRVTVVDALVLTHFHADHVDGVPGVLHGRVVRQVLTSPVREPDYQVREVARWARAAGVPVQPLYAGDTLTWGLVTARVLWPSRVIREGSVPNNASVVLDVDAPGMRILMLGDVEPPAGRQVLLALRRDPAYVRDPRFDVLKVAHHGSRLQDPRLVTAAHASVALVSVGAGNTYGHPAISTMALLHGSGTAAFRTDERGDIAITRDRTGPVRVLTTRR